MGSSAQLRVFFKSVNSSHPGNEANRLLEKQEEFVLWTFVALTWNGIGGRRWAAKR
jgi:hypothetical protein